MPQASASILRMLSHFHKIESRELKHPTVFVKSLSKTANSFGT
jgi:hypothetical protein